MASNIPICYQFRSRAQTSLLNFTTVDSKAYFIFPHRSLIVISNLVCCKLNAWPSLHANPHPPNSPVTPTAFPNSVTASTWLIILILRTKISRASHDFPGLTDQKILLVLLPEYIGVSLPPTTHHCSMLVLPWFTFHQDNYNKPPDRSFLQFVLNPKARVLLLKGKLYHVILLLMTL